MWRLLNCVFILTPVNREDTGTVTNRIPLKLLDGMYARCYSV